MFCVRNVYYLAAVTLAMIFLLYRYTNYLTISNGRPTRVKMLSVGTAQVVGMETKTTPTPVITVDAGSDFDQRVERLNVELDAIRRQIWERRGSGDWRDHVYSSPVIEVLSGARNDYLEVLAAKYPHVTAVVLPWTWTGQRVWNSLTDTMNLPRQTFYEWTADDALCTLIETPGVTNMKYDAIFNRSCVRDINETVTPRTLPPAFLNGKPLHPEQYWPNNGSSYPAHFYTRPPPFVFYLHIHRDAIVSVNGDVYSMNLQLALYTCSKDVDSELPNIDQTYDEVFVIAQGWGWAIFHEMCEILPRIALYREFLYRNPEIRVVVPEFAGRHLSHNRHLLLGLLRIVGMDASRVVVGPVRAKVVYHPRSTPCGFVNVQESQTLSKLYQDYIRKNFPPRDRKTDTSSAVNVEKIYRTQRN